MAEAGDGGRTGRLDGEVAVVTGSTTGLGVAIARLFASEGAKVVVAGRNVERGCSEHRRPLGSA